RRSRLPGLGRLRLGRPLRRLSARDLPLRGLPLKGSALRVLPLRRLRWPLLRTPFGLLRSCRTLRRSASPGHLRCEPKAPAAALAAPEKHFAKAPGEPAAFALVEVEAEFGAGSERARASSRYRAATCRRAQLACQAWNRCRA